MKRAALNDLKAWEQRSHRKPLLLYGARQVGKTHVLKEFGQQFDSFIYCDLERNGRARAVFESSAETDLEPTTILHRLSAVLGTAIDPERSLLVLDEIQASNRALASLKYFAEDMPQLRLIGAGSLLGVAVNTQGFTMPVGKVQTYTMHPMTFPEFLTALDEGTMVDEIRSCYASGSSFYLHDHLMDRLWTYALVGGMPEAVAVYRENADFREVAEVQSDIRELYVADMTKYASASETARIRDVWDSIPAQLAKPNHKFQYKAVKTGGRASRYADAIAWLLSAGLVTRCVNITSGLSPLKAHEETDTFKIYMADTGLLAQTEGLDAGLVLDEDSRARMDLGGLGENLVGQMLTANSIPLRYWTSSSTAEVDFIYERPGVAGGIPIEVKTSEHVRSRSLASFRTKYQPVEAIRISTKNFGNENGIRSIPLYAAFCIH